MEKLHSVFKAYKIHNTPPHPTTLLDSETACSDDELDFNQLYEKGIQAEDEIESYLGQPRAPREANILAWWQKNESLYPTLSKMARDFLAIPATSVPSERLLSKAALVIRKHRNRLSDDAARYLLCINSWADCQFLLK